MITSARLRC